MKLSIDELNFLIRAVENFPSGNTDVARSKGAVLIKLADELDSAQKALEAKPDWIDEGEKDE